MRGDGAVKVSLGDSTVSLRLCVLESDKVASSDWFLGSCMFLCGGVRVDFQVEL